MTTTITTPRQMTSAADLLEHAGAAIREGQAVGGDVVPTGFYALDMALSGGLRSGELALLGGQQGLGKTMMVMQIVRNVVHAGGSAVVFSYEHEGHTLLARLIALEAAELCGEDGAPLQAVRRALEETGGDMTTLEDRLSGLPGAVEGLRTLRGYAGRLYLSEASGRSTDLDEIERTVTQAVAAIREAQGARAAAPLVVVDYLQKVPVRRGSQPSESERVTIAVEGLKDLALAVGAPVLAVAATDTAGLSGGRRTRVEHLRGSVALAYEADVILLVNDKFDAVARHHLIYDLGNAYRFRQWVILSLAKNRHGRDKIDLEFRKCFSQGRFDPDGQEVLEQLIEERIFTD